VARRQSPARKRKVLVATDGSRGSNAALRFAIDLAGCSGIALTVITIAVTKRAPGATEVIQRAESSLAVAARTLRRSGVRADLHVVAARPRESIPEAILRESNRLKVDLVVIGSEGRDTLREWVVGGTALRLIYLATRPVTVVRPPRVRRRS
jgi:nucleotide-binding universal stress UspA family protein